MLSTGGMTILVQVFLEVICPHTSAKIYISFESLILKFPHNEFTNKDKDLTTKMYHLSQCKTANTVPKTGMVQPMAHPCDVLGDFFGGEVAGDGT